ncbi:hypothetical protein AO265_25775 [Pseudomonas sp. ABAC61]|nr:hypothetical protein AO265_25775 [Pseudomonas sp. ABAC61]
MNFFDSFDTPLNEKKLYDQSFFIEKPIINYQLVNTHPFPLSYTIAKFMCDSFRSKGISFLQKSLLG